MGIKMIEMFKYLTGILEGGERKRCGIIAVFGLLSPIMDLFNFTVIIYIINRAAQEKQASPQIVLFTAIMGIISILKGFFDIYRCKISNEFVYNGAQRLSMKMYELQLKEDLEHHSEKSVMQALSAVRNDTEKCVEIIINCIEILINAFIIIGYFGVLVYIAKWFGAVSCAILILLILIMYFYYRSQMKLYGEKSRMYMIRANAQVTIAYGIFKEMKLVDDMSALKERYGDASYGYAQVQGKFKYKNSIVSMIMQNSVMAVVFILLSFFLWFLKEDLAFAVAAMAVYFAVLIRIVPMAYNIVSGMNHVEFNRKSYVVLRDCLARYSEIKEEERRAENIRRKELTFLKGIFVRNLTFQYNDQAQIFEEAAIDIPTGSSVAVIGASGIGKTTLLDLITGLRRPQTGSILYDDYDIVSQTDGTGQCRANLGDIISYIPQIVYLNGETIRNNVAFFEGEDRIDDEKVIRCLKCAQVWKDIAKMPKGVHTLIGENGTAVSGGQRQRIALARALYKDFKLLVMDEATAALDMETEKAVIDSIRQVKGNKTILMVTHHMSLANECDMIYKIEDKKIVRVK